MLLIKFTEYKNCIKHNENLMCTADSYGYLSACKLKSLMPHFTNPVECLSTTNIHAGFVLTN